MQMHYEASGFKLASKDEKRGVRTAEGMTYRGEIIQVTEHHVIQKTGANVLVAHPRAALPQAVVGKAPAQIVYGVDRRAQLVMPEVRKGRGITR
ncbi:MAG: hypothetical protein Q4G70_09585 [Pseudomonadota bacterium]|nr:hypothetical protein [Pseudomonadota bacterium]